jgi:hypothetical protein
MTTRGGALRNGTERTRESNSVADGRERLERDFLGLGRGAKMSPRPTTIVPDLTSRHGH